MKGKETTVESRGNGNILWFYADGGQRLGPVDGSTMHQLIVGGAVTPETLVWRDGMPEWRGAGEVPELISVFEVVARRSGVGRGGFKSGVVNFGVVAPGPVALGTVTPGPVTAGPDILRNTEEEVAGGVSGGGRAWGAPPTQQGRLIPLSEVRERGDYAGFWLRFVAVILDNILIGGVSWAVAWVVGPFAPLVAVVAGWLYFASLESSSWQATIGKLAVGIVVTDMEGRRVTFGRATGRHFAKYFSYFTLMIGHVMAAFTERKQALHDMIASTLVVKRR